MRIARVLLHDSSVAGAPIVALERDGALYAVAELDRVLDTRYAPDRLAGASDFHTRVVALACAGLDDLNRALQQGRRPTEARLQPNSFLWLPPCATERSLYVQLGAHGDEPTYRLGNARGMVGHTSTVAFPADENEPDFELGVAVILGDDLRRATADEADKAILGLTIVNDWTARELERRDRELDRETTRARDFATQLGPVIVTRDELGDIAALRAQVRIDGELFKAETVGHDRLSLAEYIAFVSQYVDLCAGDVIGGGLIAGGSASAHGRRLAYGSTVELSIERIGKLIGRPARGPEPAAWRRPTQ